MFSGTRPKFVTVDEVSFQRPVDVGDLLRLKSMVVYTTKDDKTVSTLLSSGCDLTHGQAITRCMSSMLY